MKVKFLLAAALFAAALAGCAAENITESGSNYSGQPGGQSSNYYSQQTSEESASFTQEQSEVVMYITINSNKMKVDLAENSSAAALAELLEQGDITYTADDYGGFEKVGGIGRTLPRNDEEITTQPGDVILYTGSNICLYYGTNTWTFTRLGKINGYTADELKTLLCAGEGSVQVTLSLN